MQQKSKYLFKTLDAQTFDKEYVLFKQNKTKRVFLSVQIDLSFLLL